MAPPKLLTPTPAVPSDIDLSKLHIPRCHSTRTTPKMPFSRKKSCARCRAAKARCNRFLPRCSRCAERGLRCEYSDLRPAQYSGRTPPEANTWAPNPIVPLELLAGSFDASHMELMSTGPISARPQFDWASMTLPTLQSECLLSPASPFTPMNPIFSLPGDFSDVVNSQYSQNSLVEADPRGMRYPVPQAQVEARHLKIRPSVTPNGYFTTKIMLGQVESYPKMMIEGHSLPPFIHSRCALDDSLSDECYTKKTHQCLPQILSICASLVQLFYTKSTANSDFVWKTIYAEQARLFQEHESYDGEHLLEALQAVSIYVILQAQDPGSMAKNDVPSLIKSLSIIATRLNHKVGYDKFNDIPAWSMHRSTWMLRESIRRIGLLLYIIETLLDVIIGTDRDVVSCDGYNSMPLPCVRGLWEAKTTSGWATRYKEVVTSRCTDKMLTLTDLKTSMALSTAQLTEEKNGTLRDVMKWCEGLDPFGNMVWMATMLSKV